MGKIILKIFSQSNLGKICIPMEEIAIIQGGYFIFSQENPIGTCFTDGERWTRDENDRTHTNGGDPREVSGSV